MTRFITVTVSVVKYVFWIGVATVGPIMGAIAFGGIMKMSAMQGIPMSGPRQWATAIALTAIWPMGAVEMLSRRRKP